MDSGYNIHLYNLISSPTIIYSIAIYLPIAPPELNVLEHEALPMTVHATQQNARPTLAAVPQIARERQYGAFNQVTPLPLSFSVKPDNTVALCRAQMDNKDVILRILKGILYCSIQYYTILYYRSFAVKFYFLRHGCL